MGRYFGTDGIRDRAGRGWLSPAGVDAIGLALGEVLRDAGGGRPVVLGRDTRASGAEIAHRLTAGLTRFDVPVVDLGVIPTPGVAYTTVRLGAAAGVMISASHNPAHDNGVKVIGGDGFKVPDEVEAAIEDACDRHRADVGEGAEVSLPGDARRDAVGPTGVAAAARPHHDAYIESLVRRGGGSGALGGMIVALDCAHGAAHAIGPAVFRELGAQVTTIGDAPNGHNINAGVGATHTDALRPFTTELGAAVGFSFDGDADRVIAADAAGAEHNGDTILGVWGRELHAAGRLPGATIVATVMSNLGLELSLRGIGVTLERTPVGDRHVSARMREAGFTLGGEQSGHIVYTGDPEPDRATTGDGIATAVHLANLIATTGRSLPDLAGFVQSVPQVLINRPVRDKPDLATIDTVQAAVAAAESALGDAGRVVLRYSGTEPKVRVMLEGRDASQIRVHAEAIADALTAAIGA
jgi:phosphoglucosamine mutase